jgi:redox-sensitive bicupin YhaK (pirin superfamily)
MLKKILGGYGSNRSHWVGDGFPVRTLFSYDTHGAHMSPFLLLDFAGPHKFEPTSSRRGVGQHPHRGFETVTIVYEGEVEHRDNGGNGGIIGPGDVQWMTAARGILHEEYHSPAFSQRGGDFRMVQLWVNLPAADKMAAPGYQGIAAVDIPKVELPRKAGSVRVIAGDFGGVHGPAKTFTPINLWDVSLSAGAEANLKLPEGQTSILVVVDGDLRCNGEKPIGEAELLLLSRAGSDVSLCTDQGARLLVMTGEPIDEPIVGYGPFVMNSEAEISQAVDDFNQGRFNAPSQVTRN